MGTPVSSSEVLARFVLQSSHFRADGTLKPDPFVPHPYEELSVTRHLGITVEEVWARGRAVAAACRKTLYGRADVIAGEFLKQRLTVIAAPTADDANHANVGDWPKEKPAQKLIAQEIAAAAGRMVGV